MPRLTTTLRNARFAAAAFASFAVLALSLSSMGCHRVVVDDVRGPDGADWKRVSCNHMDKRCFREAAQMCPNGYYFAKTSSPAPEVIDAPHSAGHDGEDLQWSSGNRISSAPDPKSSNVKTLPPQETWGDGMYSRKGGTILVKCAEAKASASR
jgi:hypothetical protein